MNMQVNVQSDNINRRFLVIGSGQDLDRILCSGIEAEGWEAISCTYYDNIDNILNNQRISEVFLIINTKFVEKVQELEKDIKTTLNVHQIKTVIIYTAIPV